jgi:site-specific DNA-methyltransferase (adenine-specific)
MRELIAEGRIVQTRSGAVPQLKRYLDEMPGVPAQDMWTDIPVINNRSKEMLGYPTQKPLALLERIIRTSSNEGDTVLDPFCGCGTTIHAAQHLDRNWIGIDVAYAAIQVIEDRLHQWLPRAKYAVTGIPFDEHSARMMAHKDWFAFQQWAVAQCRGRSGGLGGDRGVDGEIIFQRGRDEYGRAIVSVKGGKHVGPAMVRELAGAVELHGADAGIFICLNEPTKEMRTAAHGIGRVELPGGDRPKIQIVTVHDLIAGPNLGIPTALNTIAAAQAATRQARKQPPKRPTPDQLRRHPPLPPMTVAGGKNTQVPMDLDEPVLVHQQPKRRRG